MAISNSTPQRCELGSTSLQAGGSVRVTCVRKMADEAALYSLETRPYAGRLGSGLQTMLFTVYFTYTS